MSGGRGKIIGPGFEKHNGHVSDPDIRDFRGDQEDPMREESGYPCSLTKKKK
jgi:hypothetical protein